MFLFEKQVLKPNIINLKDNSYIGKIFNLFLLFTAVHISFFEITIVF